MKWNDIDRVRAIGNLLPGAIFEPAANFASYKILKSRYIGTGFPTEAKIITEGERIIAEDKPLDVVRERLDELDVLLSRETEDVIKTMIQKGVISISDLPQILVDRYNEKESLRNQL